MGIKGGRASAWLVVSLTVAWPAAAATAPTVVLQRAGKQNTTCEPHVGAAQEHAATIYTQAGMSFVWADQTAEAFRNARWLQVVIVQDVHDAFVRGGLLDNALGVAVTGARRVYIFCGRIAMLARNIHGRIDRILGRVLAHELGHMLGEEHSSAGIMQATPDYSSNHAPAFSEEQSDRMRGQFEVKP